MCDEITESPARGELHYIMVRITPAMMRAKGWSGRADVQRWMHGIIDPKVEEIDVNDRKQEKADIERRLKELE